MNIVLLLGILFFLRYDHYIPKREKIILLVSIIISMLLNLQNILHIYFRRPENMHHIFISTCLSWFGYVARPLLLWGLWEILRGTRRKVIRHMFLILSVINTLIFSTCFFSDITFGYRPDTYAWYRGPLGLTSHVIMIMMMVLFIPTLVDMFFNNKKSDFMAGMLSLLVILIVVYFDTWHNKNMINDVIAYEAMIYFLFLHIGLEQEYTETLIKAQKAEMMLMQIKPHFINNTLGTIQALCEIDPPLAAHTTGAFARYLRANLTAMDKPLPIPIEEELEHTKTYLEIETLRFPWIKVVYDIQDTDFCIPALSIQPLAENAVQHGLRKKKKGTLQIRTERTDDGHMIYITDDGVGYDEKTVVLEADHGVGTRNVRYRIEEVCGGTMKVDSVVGEGTKIEIFIPDSQG